MGAWIETTIKGMEYLENKSHPSWVRGLKQSRMKSTGHSSTVAPFMGAWIETIAPCSRKIRLYVAPFMGTWMKSLELRITLNYRKLHYPVRESKMAKRMPSLHR